MNSVKILHAVRWAITAIAELLVSLSIVVAPPGGSSDIFHHSLLSCGSSRLSIFLCGGVERTLLNNTAAARHVKTPHSIGK